MKLKKYTTEKQSRPAFFLLLYSSTLSLCLLCFLIHISNEIHTKKDDAIEKPLHWMMLEKLKSLVRHLILS